MHVPVFARYFSLMGTHTAEDLFSTDLIDVAPWFLAANFNGLAKPIAVFQSGADEYLPPFVQAEEIIQMIIDNCPRGFVPLAKVLKGANHALGNAKSARDEFAMEVINFLAFLKK